VSEGIKLDPQAPWVAELRARIVEAHNLVAEAIAKSSSSDLWTRRLAKLADNALAAFNPLLAGLDGRDPLPRDPVLNPWLLWQLQKDYQAAISSGRGEQADRELAAFMKAMRQKPKGRPTSVPLGDLQKMKALRKAGRSYGQISKRLGLSAESVRLALAYHYPRKKSP